MNYKQKLNLNILIPDGDSLFALWMINCLSKYNKINIHLLSKEKWLRQDFQGT